MSLKKLQARIKIQNQQVADLEEEKERVERYLKDPYGSSEDENLQKWLKKAKNFTNGSAIKLVGTDFGERHWRHNYSFKLCLNSNSPYQLSKKAEQNCKKIAKLVQQARGFVDIQREDQNETVNRFEYHKSIEDVLDKILEAVQCPSINTIRVYGEPGTGKTMLVREVKRRAEEQKLFDAVVMASVKQNPRIQDEIACDLGVSNQEASNPRKDRRRTEKKVLLILDDIGEPEIFWKLREKLPLADENENRLLSYKILLTTTIDSHVLFDLSEIQFGIEPLKGKEAQMLFEKIATYRTERRSLPFYATDIGDKCAGLPIAVATLAKALKSGKILRKTTLLKLKSSSSSHLAFDISYDCLKSSKLQQTFLLCSLMDHNAAVRDLLKYTIGLGLFTGVNTIEEARDALLNLMTKLRGSSLLLDSGGNMQFDMHDLVIDFAKSIVLEEVGLNNWDKMESMKWIYLSNSSQLPNELNCPQLTFFHLSKEDPSSKIPTDLFAGIRQLRVLGLTKTCSMPQSISLLNNLHTLRLDQSELGDADMGTIIGKLKNLIVLSLVGCDIEELPEQIGQLSELKLLDLSDCTKLKVIPPRVLSRLFRLEELYMRNSFDQWAEGLKEQKNKNASLSELKNLKLTAIEVRINICNIQMFEEDLFSEKLKRYKIFMGDMWHSWDSSYGCSKMLKLKLDTNISLVSTLLKKTEELHLQGLRGVSNLCNKLLKEGFQELKYLFIQDAQKIDHRSIYTDLHAFPVLEVLFLRNAEKIEKICHSSDGEPSLCKLRMLTVEFCNQLKNLFSSSMARHLLQLKEIRVTKCSNMEEIVDDEEQGDENDIIEAKEGLQQLRSLILEDLPKLIGFSSSCKSRTLFKEQVASFSADKLRKLIIKGCDSLECIFSSSMARGLAMLEHLEIRECESVKELISTYKIEKTENLIFPQLNILQIEGLENLVNFYSGNCIVEFNSLKKLQVLNCPKLKGFIANTQTLFNERVKFPNLEVLRLSSIDIEQIWPIPTSKIPFSIQKLKRLFVEGCGQLKYLLTSSMDEYFAQLSVLKLCDCEMLETVIGAEEGRNSKLSFPKLDTLELEDLPKLTRFCYGNHLEFLNLKRLTISKCLALKAFSSSSATGDMAASTENAENTSTQSLFDEKVLFPNLEFLRLSSINIPQIWPIPISEISSSVQELKKLFVEGCSKLKHLLTSSMVKCFKQLSVLKLCDCEIMEGVVEVLPEEQRMTDIFFPKLGTLQLEDLPKLTRFCYGNRLEFLNLTQLTISKCLALKKFISSSVTEDMATSTEDADNTCTQSLFDEKVAFPKLQQLIIKFMGSLNKIWDDKHEATSCCQLDSLTVASCERLLNIFPFCMLERVCQKLDKLEIQNCDSLEEIFEVQVLPTPIFLFPVLTHLDLYMLPKLKGFFPPRQVIQWPSLKKLRVYGCEVHIIASEPQNFGDDPRPDIVSWISKNVLLEARSGKIYCMLAARCLSIIWSNTPQYWRWIKYTDSRIPEVAELVTVWWFEITGSINTSMLSPMTHYKAYLVVKMTTKVYGFENEPIEATVKHGETEGKRTIYVQTRRIPRDGGEKYLQEREDGWFEVELGDFFNEGSEDGELKIHLFGNNDSRPKRGIIIKGIEIRPN